MHVHTIKVSFLRSKQPASYESATPAVELTATLDEGENAAAKSRELMATACATAYAALGFATPEKAASLLGSGTTTGTIVETTNTAGSVEGMSSADLKEAAKAAAKAEKAVKKAGKTAPNKSDDIPEESAKESAKSDDIPEETAKEPAKEAAKPADDIPEESAKPTDELSEEDLSAFVGTQVAGQKITVPKVKELLATYNVARLSEVAPSDRASLKADIEALDTKKS